MKDQDQSTEAATSNLVELGRKKPTRVLLVNINIYIYILVIAEVASAHTI